MRLLQNKKDDRKLIVFKCVEGNDFSVMDASGNITTMELDESEWNLLSESDVFIDIIRAMAELC